MGLPGDPVARSDQLVAALATWADLAAAMKIQLRRHGFSDPESFDLTSDWMHILVMNAAEQFVIGDG